MGLTPFSKEERQEWFNSLPTKPCGAAVIVINEKGQVLAVKASYKEHWSLPGGVVDDGESVRAAAIRELFEESNVSLQENEVELAGVTYYAPNDGRKNSLYFLFKAHIDSSTISLKNDGEEIVAAEWLDVDEFRNRFSDSHTHLVLAADIAEGGRVPSYIEG